MSGEHGGGERGGVDRIRGFRNRVRERVIEGLPPGMELTDEELRGRIEEQIGIVSAQEYFRLDEKRQIRHEVFNSLRRMDVLQDILEDEDVTEIMVNGVNRIFIEKGGRITETGLRFEGQERLEDIAQQIASTGNRIVNESHPILDARLEDGSRVNIVVPPVAIEGPVITIRKFPKEAMTMQDLITMGAVTEEVEEFLKKMVAARYNIFISGGTGSFGAMAIPIAKSQGLTVITNGNAAGRDRVMSLGADRFIDYKQEDYAQVLKEMDGVIDTLGDRELPKEFGILKQGGHLVSLRGMPNGGFAQRMQIPWFKRMLFSLAGKKYDNMAAKNGQHYHFIFVHEDGIGLQRVSELFAEQQIKPSVDKVFTLSEINEALQKVAAGGSNGKTVLKI